MRRIFESSLEKLGRALARQHNIQVVFEGKKCCTDGQTIWLPSCGELSQETMAEMHGFLDHEVAHCLFTTFSAIKNGLLRDHRKQFHKNLLNAVEDERIEREIVKIYPGSAHNLDVINTKFGGECDAKIRAKEIEWPVRLIFAIRAVMAEKTPILDDETQPYFDRVLDLAQTLNECRSTADLCRVTKEITERIYEAHEEEPEPDSSDSESDEGESAETGEGEGSGGSESDSEADSGESESGSDESESEGGTGESEGIGDTTSGETSETAGESEGAERLMSGDSSSWDSQEITVDDRMKRIVEEEIESGETDAGPSREAIVGGRPHIPYTTKYDEVRSYVGDGDRVAYRKELSEIASVVNPIRRELEKILKVQENKKWRMNRERGSVNTRSLARLATDKNFKKPFKSQRKTETGNVAVEILIDQSGSMGRNDRIGLAKKTAIAMAEALKDIDVSFEICGFHAVDCSAPSRSERSGFNRFGEKTIHNVFKDFDSHDLSGIQKIYRGEQNVDGEAVQWAANRLAMRKEKRKIMIVLSDGYPESCSGERQIMRAHLKQTVAKVSKAGIEVIGVGIQSEAVQDFYPDSIVVRDIKDLPVKAMKKLSNIITRGSK